MPGLHNNGLTQLSKWVGNELHNMDTLLAGGAAPQEAMTSTQELAMALKFFQAQIDEATVAGTRYYRNIVLGAPTTLTGISGLIGSVGGTDKWIFELHDSLGNSLVTTALAGVTVGAANTWQQIPFTAAYLAPAGTYFIVVQSNGTTAKIAALNAPTSPLVTGSVAGSFGTVAAFTPATTFTAGVGPIAITY